MNPKSVPPSGTFGVSPPLRLLSITVYSSSTYIHLIHSYIFTNTTMFRTAIAKAAPSFRVASAPLIRPTLSFARPALTLSARGYAASAGLSKDDISSRVLEVMKTFEKVDGGKVCLFSQEVGFS
jgi:hypothetical protein